MNVCIKYFDDRVVRVDRNFAYHEVRLGRARYTSRAEWKAAGRVWD